MRAFHFRLEAVLSLRRTREEEAQTALGVAERSLAEERARAEDLAASQKRQGIYRASLLRSAIDIQAVSDADAIAGEIVEDIKAQHLRVLAAEQEVLARKSELRVRHAAREAIERLRERRLREHMVVEMAAEQQELDEVGIRKWRK